MEGEEIRSGAKKKRSKKEIGFDSEDDEPIGSIFKLKRSKKKVSCSGDGVGEKGGLGGMDDNDTLASFRKRLKGPKRDQGSVKLNVPLEVEGVVGVSDGDLVGLGPKGKEEKGDDMQMEGGSSDQHIEDSLSTIFQKVQSSSARKSRGGLRQKKGIQNVDSGLGSEGFVEAGDCLIESRSGSACGSKLVRGNVGSADALPQVSEPVVASAVDDQKCGGDECFQEESTKGNCDVDVPDGPSQLMDVCYGDRQQLSCIQVEDICCDSDQKVALQESVLSDGLNKLSSMPRDEIPKVWEEVKGFTEVGEFENRTTDEPAQVCNSASELQSSIT